jgi:bacterioferritin
MEDINNSKHLRAGYMAEVPYPSIRVMGPNKYYAEILKDDYAGKISEFSAISQYLYGDFISNNNKEISKLFENVAIIEMLHLEILADLIMQLGEDPIYTGGYTDSNRYWNSSYVFYGNNIKDQLEFSIKIEKEAINAYLKSIELIKDKYIVEILRRIILDEEVHIKLFEHALNK